jgi:uncharacterized membrane protein
MQKISVTIAKIVGIFAVTGFSFMMFNIISPYLCAPYPTDIDFLLTKQDVLPITLWRYAFYVHISTSLLTLLSGLTQFSGYIYTKIPKIHRFVGKVYIIVLLFLSAPSGLIMSFYANGGIKTQSAFALLSILWWLFTYIAYRKIKNGEIEQHAAFMIRSYALTWSAITLRLMQFLFGEFQLVDFETAYLLSAWLGWSINLAIAEVFIRLNYPKKRPF